MIPPGKILRNRYQIIKDLGGGGFGDTYLAKDLDLPGKPHCVVKHLKPKDNRPDVLRLARRLFDTEAEVLHKLGNQSPQIPSLFAHFEENGEFYLVQEFIDGHDLNTEIFPGNKLSESSVITLLKNILEVLAVAHEHQPNAVIHRDIKPANLMRRRQDGKIMLIDFGAVREINQLIVNVNGDITTTIAIGTPGYAPSEQAKGRPKLCSDVYAVGMLGIQALTGIPPHQLQEYPSTGEVIWRHLVPRINPKFADVLEKMVRDHFSQRYQNAGEALQALFSLSLPSPPPPRLIPPPPPPIISTNTTRRGFLQLVGLAGGGFALALVGQNLLNNKSSSSSRPSPQPSANSFLKTFNFETVTVNSRGQIANRGKGQARVFIENIGKGITLDMVAIPGGSFVMGSPATEKWRTNDEGQQQTVKIAPFFMGKYEVTQAQYQAVMGNNPSNFKGAKRPVENVNWNEAVEFCRKLSEKTGKSYRLPSEAEWEYACRAGTTTPFYFGDTIRPDLVNYDGNNPYRYAPKGLNRQQTTDVGSFPPNPFGLYDMHGNVEEWCSDKWQYSYFIRGGSWRDDAVDCRSANRAWFSADFRHRTIGFRVALVSA
ncbi:bifunctional serine/threonine-protein kinase/formylglycine-generating enzyme family protein [Microcoleus sp. BR0-C5]|uniref:bifunctional serine/threonine-protein kinase/formylglycine-generating enzyme family protein n=1 Tax=Microcoleus sp. BR0-C5 TaxID=2818713 RepID=UPI002FD2405B